MTQTTESDQRPFAPEQKGLHKLGSSPASGAREPAPRPAAKTISWLPRDFDRPCPVSSPLNEW